MSNPDAWKTSDRARERFFEEDPAAEYAIAPLPRYTPQRTYLIICTFCHTTHTEHAADEAEMVWKLRHRPRCQHCHTSTLTDLPFPLKIVEELSAGDAAKGEKK